MNLPRGSFSLPLALLVSCLDATTSLAQTVAPVGGEFQVNQYTLYNQLRPAVGMDNAGNFVVTWDSARDGAGTGIFARRFNSAGASVGSEFQVNVSTIGDQRRPGIDMNSTGAFVITWENDNVVPGWVFARRYTASGAAQGSEIQLSTYTGDDGQELATVGIDDQGDFVVSWGSFRSGGGDIFARRFNSAGAPLGADFLVNLFTTGFQGAGRVDAEPDGDFVIVWEGYTPDSHIFARRFTSAGTPLDDALVVNNHSALQYDASVGVDADGDFVVVWTSGTPATSRAFARRFHSNGVADGDEFQANVTATGGQFGTRVAVDSTGDFVLTWNGPDPSGDGVFMRRFRADGSAKVFDVLVNTATTGRQYQAVVAADGDGDFVVAWASAHTAAPRDIFAQRFDVSALLDVDGNGVVDPLTDALLVLRFSFGFSGGTLITGAVGAGCTRCDAPSITAYLQSFV